MAAGSRDADNARALTGAPGTTRDIGTCVAANEM